MTEAWLVEVWRVRDLPGNGRVAELAWTSPVLSRQEADELGRAIQRYGLQFEGKPKIPTSECAVLYREAGK